MKKNIAQSALSVKKILVLLIVIAVAGIVFWAIQPQKDFDIGVDISKGTKAGVKVFSDEDISSSSGKITLVGTQELWDSEISLFPVSPRDAKQAVPESQYITPGLTVSFEVQKDAWYKICLINPEAAAEDYTVYVTAKDVAVQIAESSLASMNAIVSDVQNGSLIIEPEKGSPALSASNVFSISPADIPEDLVIEPGDLIEVIYDGTILETYPASFHHIYDLHLIEKLTMEDLAGDSEGETIDNLSSLSGMPGQEQVIEQAILANNGFADLEERQIAAVSFHPLAHSVLCGRDSSTDIFYGWALYEEFELSNQMLQNTDIKYVPAIITLLTDDNGIILQEYWQQPDKNLFEGAIQEKFPADIVEEALRPEPYLLEQKQECYEKAIEAYALNPNLAIESLLDVLCQTPSTSSSIAAYFQENPEESDELLSYGEHTLTYIFNSFLQGGQRDLKGSLMQLFMQELAPDLILNIQAQDAQAYFDEVLLHVKQMESEKGQEWMQENMPHGLLLLEQEKQIGLV